MAQQRRRQGSLLEKRDKKVFGSSLARAGQGFAALPASRRELKRPSCLTRKADPPKLTRSEGRTPYSKGGPPLPERRTPLTRKADPPYPKGGPSLPERRAFLTRKAGTTYSRGGCTLYSRAREADTLYSQGGYSLLGRRILLTRKLLARRILLTREADTPYSEGGYSLLGRRVLLTRKAGTPYSGGGPVCRGELSDRP